MAFNPILTLNTGAKFPAFGLGTWQSARNEVYNAVKTALSLGYRHIDCAWIYGNEDEVGKAFQEFFTSGGKREDLFVTSKLWNTYHHAEDVRTNITDTLSKLQLSYVDLYLIHWPMPFQRGGEVMPKDANGNVIPDTTVTIKETWQAMEAIHKEGLAKAIGVSNFNINQVKDLLSYATIKPAANQIELQPYMTQTELVDFCQKNGIVITAYSPLGSPARPGASSSDPVLLEDPKVLEIAKKHGKTASQVLIRFHLDQGRSAIPKSVNPQRIAENYGALDFQLTPEDIKELNALNRNFRFISFGMSKVHPQYPF